MKQEMDAAVVNAGCLMFFPEPQRVSLKNDVLDSMLYVQLAASKQHSKFAEPEKWNETRLAAAQRFGWLPSANEHVSQPLPPESVETVWSCMARALAPLVSAETLVRAETFMRKVSTRSTANDALDLLRSQAIQSGLNHAGKLQVSVLLQLAFVDTQQNLKLAQFQFATRQPLSAGFLFEVIEPKSIYGNIAVTVYAMQLFEKVYAQFRDGIDTALSSKRAGLIMPLGGSPDV
ncbi:hypothetical protein [Pseudomonas congelans]|uniref:hypothetical protein n=1 Tax=Pseudomonas congelans TaxID=200452 RepID=UPI001BDBD10E|nr:hypothetical protein [Pseudomonas congelans]QVX12272.1 hypothetical protein DBV21_21540 [Pseudomonas congelans]